MKPSCEDGSHAEHILEAALDARHPFVIISLGPTGTESCGIGNIGSLGVMLRRLYADIERYAGHYPPEDCTVCQKHLLAVRAAMAAYDLQLRESGYVEGESCQ